MMFPPVSIPTTLLKVKVHLQDNRNACGPACAEMVLLFLTDHMYQQTELKPPHPSSGTSPDELCALINNKLATTPAKDPSLRYKVYSEATRKDALDRIWRGLQRGYPSVSLCRPSADHWVVVRGITDGTPATVHTRNPLPNRMDTTTDRPLPNHGDKDSCAGWDKANAGSSDEAVPADSQFCMNPVPGNPQTHAFGGSFVVVAPDLPATGETPEYRSESPTHDLSTSQLAVKRLEETGLLESPEWSHFAGASLVADDMCVSVDGLTDAGDAFDLVQLTNTVGDVALVRLSKDGKFMGALLQPSEKLASAQFVNFKLPFQVLQAAPNKAQPNGGGRPVWSYSRPLFFSPFVFALELPHDSGGGDAGPRPPIFIRPYDKKHFESLSDDGAAD